MVLVNMYHKHNLEWFKQTRPKGGRWGYQYKINDNLDSDTWKILFRHNVL